MCPVELFLAITVVLLVSGGCFAVDCRLLSGKPVKPGCSGCEEDPQVITNCLSTGQWEKERCPGSAKCVYGEDICKAKCVSPSMVGSPYQLAINNRTAKHCQLNGTQYHIACSLCSSSSHQDILVCTKTGSFEKQKCQSGYVCVSNKTVCGAFCDGTSSGLIHDSSAANRLLLSTLFVLSVLHLLCL